MSSKAMRLKWRCHGADGEEERRPEADPRTEERAAEEEDRSTVATPNSAGGEANAERAQAEELHRQDRAVDEQRSSCTPVPNDQT